MGTRLWGESNSFIKGNGHFVGGRDGMSVGWYHERNALIVILSKLYGPLRQLYIVNCENNIYKVQKSNELCRLDYDTEWYLR